MKKYKIILTIVFFVHFLIYSLLLYFAYGILGQQTEKSTQEYTATVSYVTAFGTGEDRMIQIFTNEYSSCLMVVFGDADDRMNMAAVEGLQSGDTIRFRVPKRMESAIDKGSFVNIVSLESDAGTLLAIEETNKYVHEDYQKDLISVAVMTGMLLLLALGFGLSMIKDWKKMQKEKTADRVLID